MNGVNNFFLLIVLFYLLKLGRLFDLSVDLGHQQLTNVKKIINSKEKSNFVVDGFFLSSSENVKCFHTGNDEPWLVVKFDKNYFVRQVRVLSPNSGKLFQNTTFRTSLTELLSPSSFNEYEFFARYEGSLAKVNSVTLSPVGLSPYARSLLLHSDQGVYLAICELEIFSLKNIVFNKNSSMNSSHELGPPSWANDGQTSNHFGRGKLYCSHSLNNKNINDWWKVDLTVRSAIYAFSIVSRESNPERNQNIRAAVGNDDSIPSLDTQQTCAINSQKPKKIFTFRCPKGTNGRYFSIQETTKSVVITICEINIFGIELNKTIDYRFLMTNNNMYENLNVSITSSCNNEVKVSAYIAKYNLNSFTMSLKGVEIIEYCKKNKIIPSVSKISNRNDLSLCVLENYFDGYETERDMNDECKYVCSCKGHCEILELNRNFHETEVNFREIYSIIQF